MSSWSPVVPIPVLVLAAGGSRRFGSDKLLATVARQPLLAWTLEAVVDVVPTDHVLVVLGRGQEARAALCDGASVPTLLARHAADGMRWSLQEGLDACPEAVPGAVVVLADDPVAVRCLPGVLAAARGDLGAPAAVRREPFLPHPVYLPRACWPAPPSSDADHGLRELLAHDHTRWIDDDGPRPVDVDVPDDVARLEAVLSAR